MVPLIALAVAASAPQNRSAPGISAVQATATVRILSGVRLKFDGTPNGDAPPPTQSVVHNEGKSQPARLIEFP